MLPANVHDLSGGRGLAYRPGSRRASRSVRNGTHDMPQRVSVVVSFGPRLVRMMSVVPNRRDKQRSTKAAPLARLINLCGIRRVIVFWGRLGGALSSDFF